MKIKMKGKASKAKGKAIVGIAMAAIIVASVMAAMIGSTGADSNGGQYNIIINDGGASVQAVLIGQDVSFPGWPSGGVTIYRVKEGTVQWTKPVPDSNILTISGDAWTREGVFYVNFDGTVFPVTYDAQLSFDDADMPLTLKVGTKEVSSIAVDTNLKIDTGGMNLFPEDRVDLKIVGPDGQIKYDEINNQKFTNISVDNPTDEYPGTLKNYSICLKTKGWTIGDYTFQVKTKSANACGLAAASAVKDLKILKEAIEIDADKTSTVELEQVTLTVTGVSGDEIEVSGDSKDVKFKRGVLDTPWENSSYVHKYYDFTDTIDADSVRKYAVEFDDTGTYTMTVTVTGPAGNPRIDDYDAVDITVSEKGVDFDMPATVVIGERVTIKGTATSGTFVSVYIDDVLYRQLQDLVLEDGVFSKEVTTTDVGMGIPGTVRLKAWIDCDKNLGDDPPATPADGETAILLTTPELTAELSPTVLAIEDDFTVEGTAPGSRQVTILCVAPEGGGGKSLLDKGVTGVALRKASVSMTDHTFTKQMTVQEDAALGYYDIYVLSPGMDGEWDMTGTGDLEEALNIRYGIPSLTEGIIHTKSQEEIYNILDDMVHCAGSDDLMWLGKILVLEMHLNATLSKTTVPLGDSFGVYGNASSNYVEVVAISPEGGNGTGMDGLYGTTIYTVPTVCNSTNYDFYKKIKVDTGADNGNYTILVLYPGRDSVYGNSPYKYIDNLLDLDGAGPELGMIDVSNKMQEEIVAIIEDIIYAAGSDDFMWIGNIVVTQFVSVSVTRDLPDTAYLGEEINVSLTQSGFFSIGEGGIGTVTETLPEGFKFRGLLFLGGDRCDYDETTNDLMIKFKGEATITYVVEAGTVEQIENAVFSGTWTTTDSQMNKINGDVTGDTKLTVSVSTFDTGSGTYPSIFGTHNGTITPYQDINVSKMYTYSCPGTGGHTEHIKIWNNSNWNVTANWDGYTGDWHNISFNQSFTLEAGNEYNYTIRTGSYPQIIHESGKGVIGGVINCTGFTDANGRRYNNWIPAIRLE